jgi:hypothetical protein
MSRADSPVVVWSPSTFDFGSVQSGHPATHTFTLSADKGKVKGIDVSVSGSSAFSITDDNCSGSKSAVTAKDGGTCTVTVQYSPASASDAGTLTADTTQDGRGASIDLTGSGAFTFTTTMNGQNESPPRATTATGSATVVWDTTTQQMSVNATFSGLTTPNTAAHIHCCVAPGGNTGVATTTPTFTGFPGGITSGTYSHTFDMTNAASYNPAFVSAQGGVAQAEAALFNGLLAGNAYLNIHTQMFGGGEIRGFLTH